MRSQTKNRGILSALWGLRKQKKQQLKILVLGLDNAGKTTILKMVCGQDIQTITPTKGFNIKSVSMNNFKLNVWDVGGQKSIRQYWSNYISNCHGLIYVVDSADVKRVKQAGSQLQNILLQKQLREVPLLILANKQDLVQALQPQQLLKQLKIGQIKTRPFSIQACIGKKGDGVEEGLDWLVKATKK